MNISKNKHLIKKWIAGSLSPDEKTALLLLLNENFKEQILPNNINSDKVLEFNTLVNNLLGFLDKKID